MFKITLCIFSLIILFQSVAFSETQKDSIGLYREATTNAYKECSLLFSANQLTNATPDNPNFTHQGCIENKEKALTNAYKAISKSIKNTSAKNSLKKYHIATITALKGIDPGFNESNITYRARQRSLEDKMNEAWTEFDLDYNQ